MTGTETQLLDDQLIADASIENVQHEVAEADTENTPLATSRERQVEETPFTEILPNKRSHTNVGFVYPDGTDPFTSNDTEHVEASEHELLQGDVSK